MKFRRKASEQPGGEDAPSTSSEPGTSAEVDPRAEGPWDSSEVDLDDDTEPRVDLGGLLVAGNPELELRLQVDEASQQIVAVLLVGQEGAVELRPFAAPRNNDLWDDIRGQIAAETVRLGGAAEESDGHFGTELQVVMNLTTAEGEEVVQPSRVLGISGPRWLLRATFLGRPAVEPVHDGVIETALRQVVVVRGNTAMAPGEPLPLVLPAGTEPVAPPQ